MWEGGEGPKIEVSILLSIWTRPKLYHINLSIHAVAIRNVQSGAESYPSRPSGALTYKNCTLNMNDQVTRATLASCDIPCPPKLSQFPYPGFGCCCVDPSKISPP